MNIDQFERILNDQLKVCRDILGSKGHEYATDQDRLHNFKAAAALQGVTLREALGGMMIKHTVSIYDMIGDEAQHTVGEWDEKITDHISYLILLKAVVLEEFAVLDSGVQDRLKFDQNYHDAVLAAKPEENLHYDSSVGIDAKGDPELDGHAEHASAPYDDLT